MKIINFQLIILTMVCSMTTTNFISNNKVEVQNNNINILKKISNVLDVYLIKTKEKSMLINKKKQEKALKFLNNQKEKNEKKILKNNNNLMEKKSAIEILEKKIENLKDKLNKKKNKLEEKTLEFKEDEKNTSKINYFNTKKEIIQRNIHRLINKNQEKINKNQNELIEIQNNLLKLQEELKTIQDKIHERVHHNHQDNTDIQSLENKINNYKKYLQDEKNITIINEKDSHYININDNGKNIAMDFKDNEKNQYLFIQDNDDILEINNKTN